MLEIFQYSFIQRAFIVGTLVGLICPLIGSFLILKRFSALADTLSHISLLGVTIALILGFSPTITAILTSLAASFGINRFKKGIFGESVLTIFLSSSLGIVSILISIYKGFTKDLWSYLFGSLNTITIKDVWTILIVFILVFSFIMIFYRQFFCICLDSELAQSAGINSELFNLLLVILAAITISVSLPIIGGLLIGALIIIPIISAWQFGLTFVNSLILASSFGVFSVWIGILISYYFNLATGGCVVLSALFIFLTSLLINKKYNSKHFSKHFSK